MAAGGNRHLFAKFVSSTSSITAISCSKGGDMHAQLHSLIMRIQDMQQTCDEQTNGQITIIDPFVMLRISHNSDFYCTWSKSEPTATDANQSTTEVVLWCHAFFSFKPKVVMRSGIMNRLHCFFPCVTEMLEMIERICLICSDIWTCNWCTKCCTSHWNKLSSDVWW